MKRNTLEQKFPQDSSLAGSKASQAEASILNILNKEEVLALKNAWQNGEFDKVKIEYLLLKSFALIEKNPPLLDLLDTPEIKNFLLKSLESSDENLNKKLDKCKENIFKFYQSLITGNLFGIYNSLKGIKFHNFNAEQEGGNFLIVIHELALKEHFFAKFIIDSTRSKIIKLIEENNGSSYIIGKHLPNLIRELEPTLKLKFIDIVIKNFPSFLNVQSLIPIILKNIENYAIDAINLENTKMALFLSKYILYGFKVKPELLTFKPLNAIAVISSESAIWDLATPVKDNYLDKVYKLALKGNHSAVEIMEEILSLFKELTDSEHYKSFQLIRLLPNLIERLPDINKHKIIKATIDSGNIKLVEELVFNPQLWLDMKDDTFIKYIDYAKSTKNFEIVLYLQHTIFDLALATNKPILAYKILQSNFSFILGYGINKTISDKHYNINYKDDQDLRIIDKAHQLYDYISALKDSAYHLYTSNITKMITKLRLYGSVEPQNPFNINIVDNNYNITEAEAFEIFKLSYESFENIYKDKRDEMFKSINRWVQEVVIGNFAPEDWANGTCVVYGRIKDAMHKLSKDYKLSSAHYEFLTEKIIPQMGWLIISDNLHLSEPLSQWREAHDQGIKLRFDRLLSDAFASDKSIEIYSKHIQTNSFFNFGQFKTVKSDTIQEYYDKMLIESFGKAEKFIKFLQENCNFNNEVEQFLVQTLLEHTHTEYMSSDLADVTSEIFLTKMLHIILAQDYSDLNSNNMVDTIKGYLIDDSEVNQATIYIVGEEVHI